MELKRKLTKLAGRMTPQIEAMNVANEMGKCIAKISQLVDYAEEKIERSAQRKRDKEGTIGGAAAAQQAADRKEVTDTQTKESDENLADQAEAFEERNSAHRERTGNVLQDTPEEVAPPPAAKKKAKKKKKKVAKKKK